MLQKGILKSEFRSKDLPFFWSSPLYLTLLLLLLCFLEIQAGTEGEIQKDDLSTFLKNLVKKVIEEGYLERGAIE